VGPIQLDQVLAAERSAEVTHEGDYDRAPPPPLAELDRPIDRLDRDLGERVALGEAAH
jgi:hypothetical protein